MLETVGTVDNFIRAVEQVPGMEWLAEVEEEEIPPDDDFFALSQDGEARPGKTLRGRLFMVFTNQDALKQMLSLWDAWQSDERLPHGLGRWTALFQQLRDVRRWGVQDRLQETGVLDDWEERIEHDHEVVPCEVELWYRRNPEKRRDARNRVAMLVDDLGGRVVAEADIEEIAYHTLLVRLPAVQIEPLIESLDSDIELIQCEQIQFFRATGQMSSPVPEDVREQDQRGFYQSRNRPGFPSWRCSTGFRCKHIADFEDGSSSMTPMGSSSTIRRPPQGSPHPLHELYSINN